MYIHYIPVDLQTHLLQSFTKKRRGKKTTTTTKKTTPVIPTPYAQQVTRATKEHINTSTATEDSNHKQCTQARTRGTV